MARGRYPIGSGDNDDLHARCGCEVANFRADDLSFAYANLTRTASSPQRIPGRTVASPSSPGPPQRQVRAGIISQVKFFLSAVMGSLRWGCQIGKFDFFTPPRDIRSERRPKIAWDRWCRRLLSRSSIRVMNISHGMICGEEKPIASECTIPNRRGMLHTVQSYTE